MKTMTQIPKLDVDQLIKWHSETLPKIPDNLIVYSEVIEFVNRDKDVTLVTKLLLNNSSTCNMLQSLQDKGSSHSVTQGTPVTHKNDDVKNILNNPELIEERAGIIEYDSTIPRCWAEAIVKVRLSSRPKFISQQKWDKIKVDLEEVCSSYLKDIIFHEWTIADIFGCHPTLPEVRLDFMGLLMLLNEGDRVIKIEKNNIEIQNDRGVITNYYRPLFYSYLVKQSCIYEI